MEIEIKYLDETLERTYGIDYATPGAAAVDIRACIDVRKTIMPGCTYMVPSGFAIHMEYTGVAAILLPRSGLGAKDGIVLGNTVGLIDSDYQEQIFISVLNRNLNKSVIINPYDRIAQMMFIPVIRPELKEVKQFSTSTNRGGFGSTGVK